MVLVARWTTLGWNPASGSKEGSVSESKQHGVVELTSQRWDVSKLERNNVRFFNAVEGKFSDVLQVFCSSETNGDFTRLGESRR